MKLYRPTPGSETLHVSEEDLGDINATCTGNAIAFSPANCVLTADQCAKLALAARATQLIRLGYQPPATVELVEGSPPEWVEPEAEVYAGVL